MMKGALSAGKMVRVGGRSVETNQHDSHGVAGCDDRGQGRNDEQDVRDDTDSRAHADRLVLAPLGVGEDAAGDGQDVCEQGE